MRAGVISGSGMSGPPTVLVMAKAPRPGRVKTRLHPLLGPRGCAALQAVLVRTTVAMARAAGRRVVVAFDPPEAEAEAEIRALAGAEVELIAQRGTHLGERMAFAADDALPSGGDLVVIGTDAPTMASTVLGDAFTHLASGAASAIGPAEDGGYYLLATRWPRPSAFAIDPVLWSGPQVLAATLARLRRAGRIELLPRLRDLDTPEDAAALLADPALPAPVRAALGRSPSSDDVQAVNRPRVLGGEQVGAWP